MHTIYLMMGKGWIDSSWERMGKKDGRKDGIGCEYSKELFTSLIDRLVKIN